MKLLELKLRDNRRLAELLFDTKLTQRSGAIFASSCNSYTVDRECDTPLLQALVARFSRDYSSAEFFVEGELFFINLPPDTTRDQVQAVIDDALSLV